jgi:hypothetical protein
MYGCDIDALADSYDRRMAKEDNFEMAKAEFDLFMNWYNYLRPNQYGSPKER